MKKYLLLSIFALLSTIKLLSQTGSLVANFNFSGNAFDNSGYNHNGTTFNCNYVPDKNGNPAAALYLKGDSYVEINNAPALNPTTYTLSAWVFLLDYTGAASYIISKGSDDEIGHYGLLILNGKKIAQAIVGQMGGTVKFVESPQQVELGKWIHLSTVYNGSELKLFINGALSIKSSAADNYLLGYNTGKLYIGKNPNYGYEYFFNGFIDDVRIYNTPLSDSEVYELYSGVKTNIKENFEQSIKIESGKKGKLLVSKSISENVICRVYNIQGVQVDQKDINADVVEFSLDSNFKNGVYLVKITNMHGDNLLTKKIIFE